jgi:hypothetical protein
MQETEVKPCPSCGKPNPPQAQVCRFCAASMQERLHIGLVTMGVFVLLGLAVVHFAAAITYTPRYTPIPELLSEMNFEKVRVLGRVGEISVVRGPYNSHQVRIELEAQDSPRAHPALRKITARLEGEAANDFVKLKEPIRKGDMVEVAASLFAGEGYRHLSVSSPQFIFIKERGRSEPRAANDEPATTVQELLGSPDKYRNKNVQIGVAEIVSVGDGVPVLRIADPGRTGKDLTVFGYEGTKFSVGQKVSVRGQFFFYDKKGYWEIKTPFGDDQAVVAVSENTTR